MILELLELLFTPASPTARSLGFLKSAIEVRSRFSRCRKQWHPHLQKTKALILEAARQCPNRRKVVLLGAGLLHDIPLAELSAQFERVVLVDMVHLLPSRWAARRFPNVHRISCDITGIMHLLTNLAENIDTPLPTSHPDLFLTDPDLDLTVSVNLLSQLTWIPSLLLDGKRPDSVLEAFYKHLVQSHLDYLRNLPGHTALVTDVSWTRTHKLTEKAETWNVIQQIPLPNPEPRWQWDWQIAPAPEREADFDYSTSVSGYPDWKASIHCSQA